MTRSALLLLICLALAAVSWAVYSGAPDNEFIWDDPIVFSQQLPYFDSLSNVFFPPRDIPQFADRYYRPVIVLTYMVDEWLATTFWPEGDRARAREVVYHSSCVIYHLVTTVLVFLLGLSLHRWAGLSGAGGVVGAAVGALWFAVHPIHVESVAWMAGRSDVVCGLFFVATLCLYCWHRIRGGLALLVGALFCALAAMLSKETGVALVFALPLLEWMAAPIIQEPVVASRAERRRAERDASAGRSSGPITVSWPLRLGLVAAVVLTYFLLRSAGLASMHAGRIQRADDWAERFLGAGWWYLRKAIWPPPQSAFVSEIPTGSLPLTLAVLVPLLAVAAGIWWSRRTPGGAREFAALMLYFFAAAPSMAIALYRISETPLAERYLYIPTVGGCLLAGFLLERLADRLKNRALQVVLPVAIGLAVATPAGIAARQRGEVWQNNLAFWTDTVEKAPDQGLPHLHLGITYSERRADAGQPPNYWEQKAIEQYQRALETYDDAEGRSKSHNNLGSVYIGLGQYDQAITHFEQATQIDTRYPNAHYNWGMALLAKAQSSSGDQTTLLVQQAISHLEQAISFNPRYVKAHLQLGNVLIRAGRTPELVSRGRHHLEEAARLAPASSEGRRAREILQQLAPGTTAPAPAAPG